MQEELVMFGPLDVYLAPYVEFLLLGLVVVNMAARHRAHSLHKRQADEEGADGITRDTFHFGTNVLLLLGSFYYMTVHHHGGLVLSVLVLGLVLTDVFEFESRKVEARRQIPLERPKGAIGASVFVLLYAAYDSLFFLVADYWALLV